ncbi:MAG TPA: hypothetical protein VN616_12940 [Puia sp.]|nr:hypothetical protein [Puia sp.]
MTKVKGKEGKTKEENNSPILAIRVKRIKETFFFINERLHIPDPSKLVKLELIPMLGFHLESNSVGLLIRAYYHYEDRPLDEILVDVKVETRFEILNLTDCFDETGTLILPQDTIVTIVSLSISHTRAILAQSLSGTVWQEVIMPLINPTDIARFYFAYMFGEEKEVIKTDEAGNILGKATVNRVEKPPAKTTKRARSKNSY